MTRQRLHDPLMICTFPVSWEYFSHDQSRSRAYRWGEDGLLGITDRQCRLCFAVALWNGRDPILKERLFGVTGPEVSSEVAALRESFYIEENWIELDNLAGIALT